MLASLIYLVTCNREIHTSLTKEFLAITTYPIRPPAQKAYQNFTSLLQVMPNCGLGRGYRFEGQNISSPSTTCAGFSVSLRRVRRVGFLGFMCFGYCIEMDISTTVRTYCTIQNLHLLTRFTGP